MRVLTKALALSATFLVGGLACDNPDDEPGGSGGVAGSAGSSAGSGGTSGAGGSTAGAGGSTAGAGGSTAGSGGAGGSGECTELPEQFDQDTTLPKGCYLAQATPKLASGMTLTLAPGVTILFSKNAGLSVSGDQALVANGTEEDPILLTGAEKTRGFWGGVILSANQSPDTSFDHVTIEYGGSTTAANDPDAAGLKAIADSSGVRFSMRHSTIRESGGWGLWLTGSAQMDAFSGNTFTQNTLGPASLDSETIGQIDDASTWSGNDVDRLEVRASSISKTAAWPALDVPYFIASDLEVVAEWSLGAGATLVMAKDASIEVSGNTAAFIAQGTEDKPILVTGDVKQRGSWGAVILTNAGNPKNVMSWVTVEHGGRGVEQGEEANVTMNGTGNPIHLAMSHCTLRESGRHGLSVGTNSTLPEFDGNTFTKNNDGPVTIDSAVAHQLLSSSTYAGNDVDRIHVRAQWVSAEVTWAALDVPWFIDGSIGVQKVWTITPGATLILAKDTDFTVAGDAAAVRAVGTAQKPILFTGEQKTAGFWRGFVINTSINPSNRFEFATLEYGGGSVGEGTDQGMIVLTSDSHGAVVTVKNCTLQHSARWAVYLSNSYASANSDIDSVNTFSDNAQGDVFHGK